MAVARKTLPVLMGAGMGAMMLAMLHRGSGDLALGFVLAHVAVVGVAAAIALYATRRGWSHHLRWVHLPNRQHALHMGGGAVAMGALVCLLCVTGLMGMM